MPAILDKQWVRSSVDQGCELLKDGRQHGQVHMAIWMIPGTQVANCSTARQTKDIMHKTKVTGNLLLLLFLQPLCC